MSNIGIPETHLAKNIQSVHIHHHEYHHDHRYHHGHGDHSDHGDHVGDHGHRVIQKTRRRANKRDLAEVFKVVEIDDDNDE